MKKNYLLAIASYQDEWKQNFFENVVAKRNKEYCKYHNLEYIEITSNYANYNMVRVYWPWYYNTSLFYTNICRFKFVYKKIVSKK